MPVLKYFGLAEYPFSLTPNPALYFPWDEHKAILASVQFALQRGDGLLKVVGEVGTGKTMLCRLLLQEIVRTDNCAYLNAPIEDLKLLPMVVCREFGIVPADPNDPYTALTEFLLRQHAEGRHNILVVDEAQALGRSGLEIVRLLSNLETETKKLLQIVMFGQVELNKLLQHHSLRQVAQRINFSFETKPLTRELAIRYIEHRVDRSSIEQVHHDLFDRSALNLIASASRGIPRVINLLADKALLSAFGDDSRQVKRKHVLAAIADSDDIGLKRPGLLAWFAGLKPRWTATGAVGVVAAAGLAYLYALDPALSWF